MIGKEKLERVIAFCEEQGETETLNEYNINIETLHRYQRLKRTNETSKPKILLLDIETTHIKFRGWSCGKQYIRPDQVIDDWFILGWSARWLFSPETMSDFVTPQESLNKDDSRVCRSIWSLMDDASVLVAHNGKNFDLLKLNTRFVVNKFAPTSPYQVIDTCLFARKWMGFTSNSLNYLGKYLLRKEKLKTDEELWIKCEAGDQEALDYMEKYCKVDTELLEELYLILRPFMKSHPNMGLLMDSEKLCCPNCGSTNIEYTDHYYTTPANQYRVVRCKDCGAPNRLPKGVVSFEDRKNLVRSIAR